MPWRTNRDEGISALSTDNFVDGCANRSSGEQGNVKGFRGQERVRIERSIRRQIKVVITWI